MNDTVIALIRTIVPAIAGGIVAWFANQGIEIDPGALVVVLVPICTGLYYAAVRWLAKTWPKLEWFLGYPARPNYGAVEG